MRQGHSMTVPGKERKLKMVPFSTCTHHTDLPGNRGAELGQSCPISPMVFNKSVGGQAENGNQVRRNIVLLF